MIIHDKSYSWRLQILQKRWKLTFPNANTKKHWKHFFVEIDEDNENEYSFGSEWVSALKAVVLKRKQLYKKQFYCTDCEEVYTDYVKKKCK